MLLRVIAGKGVLTSSSPAGNKGSMPGLNPTTPILVNSLQLRCLHTTDRPMMLDFTQSSYQP